MDTNYTVDEEFSVPEIRERLRRAYRRLATEVQRRVGTQGMAQVSTSSAGEEQEVQPERRQTYTQEHMFSDEVRNVEQH